MITAGSDTTDCAGCEPAEGTPLQPLAFGVVPLNTVLDPRLRSYALTGKRLYRTTPGYNRRAAAAGVVIGAARARPGARRGRYPAPPSRVPRPGPRHLTDCA